MVKTYKNVRKIFLLAGLVVALGAGANIYNYLARNDISFSDIKNNTKSAIEAKLNDFMSTKLDYTEIKQDNATYVGYKNQLYEVIETNYVKDRGLDYLVGLEEIRYTEEQRYLNSEYNKEHGVRGIPQPGDKAYVLKLVDNPKF